MENKGVICYDVLLIPETKSFEEIWKIKVKSKLLIYDSYNAIMLGILKPYPYYIKTGKKPKYAIDVSTARSREACEEIIKKLEKNESNN